MMRTGAASGVATKYMAREDADVLALFGTGWQARGQLLAVAAVRRLREVRVYGRDPERRAQVRRGDEPSSRGWRLWPRPVARGGPGGSAPWSPRSPTLRQPVFPAEAVAPAPTSTPPGSNGLLRQEIARGAGAQGGRRGGGLAPAVEARGRRPADPRGARLDRLGPAPELSEIVAGIALGARALRKSPSSSPTASAWRTWPWVAACTGWPGSAASAKRWACWTSRAPWGQAARSALPGRASGFTTFWGEPSRKPRMLSMVVSTMRSSASRLLKACGG